MSEVTFTPAEIASWRDAPLVVQAAKAQVAGRISWSELRLVAAYAAGRGQLPPNLVTRVIG